MDNLICMECGTTYYSAAAKAMVERGERCDCGGLLRLSDEDEPASAPTPPDRQGVNLTVITSPSFIS
jgi:hypothetical protein